MAPAGVMIVMVLLCAAAAVSANRGFWGTGDTKGKLVMDRPYVIGHRGICGLYPEHTLMSYRRAADAGADFVECDVVLTKDLVPICRHEPLLSLSTDADTKFPDRNTTYNVDGEDLVGIFAADLTLEEVKTLRAKEVTGYRPDNSALNFKWQVPTLEEYIQTALEYPGLGIYPETKHPSYHDSLPAVKAAGTTISDIVLAMLEKYNYTGPVNSPAWLKRPVYIQSFEYNNLIALSKKTCIPLVQLADDISTPIPYTNMTYEWLLSDAGLDMVKEYASGVGPWKVTLVTLDDVTAKISSTGITERIHARNMQIHPYTFREEPSKVYIKREMELEFDMFFRNRGVNGALYLDGVFTDQSHVLRKYITKWDMAGWKWAEQKKSIKKSGSLGCRSCPAAKCAPMRG